MSNPSPRSDFTQTYFTLRLLIALIALALPIVLLLGGVLSQGVAWQPSISAYYHSNMRDVFVGGLWAVGISLIAYKGFSVWEDRLLDLGGILACCIALFPMRAQDALPCIDGACFSDGHFICAVVSEHYDRTWQVLIDTQMHFLVAVGFYAVLWLVMTFFHHNTLILVPKNKRHVFLILYPAFAQGFLLSILVVWWLGGASGAQGCDNHTIWCIEVAGIASFSAFWLLKTYECSKFDVDRLATNRHKPREAMTTETMEMQEQIAQRTAWHHYRSLW